MCDGGRLLLTLIAGLCIAVAACASDPPEPSGGASAPDTTAPTDALEASVVVDAGGMVTGLAELDGVLYFLRRDGEVFALRQVDGERVFDADPVLDVSERVRRAGTEGAFDLVADPERGVLYLSMTAVDGTLAVERAVPDGPELRPDGRTAVIDSPLNGRNGGGMVLLPDGDLALGVGDGNMVGSAEPSAADPTTSYGTVLRVPLGRSPSAGPATFADTEVLAYGLRNPWTLAVSSDDTMWIGDVGGDLAEELDRLPLGDVPGNFGWPSVEGEAVTATGRALGVSAEASLAPELALAHDESSCAVVVGPVISDPRLPDLDGAVVIGDFCSTVISAYRPSTGELLELSTVEAPPVSFGEDGSGVVHVLGSDGRVFRLDPPGTDSVPVRVEGTVVAMSELVLPPAPPSSCRTLDAAIAASELISLDPEQVEARVDDLRAALDPPQDLDPVIVERFLTLADDLELSSYSAQVEPARSLLIALERDFPFLRRLAAALAGDESCPIFG